MDFMAVLCGKEPSLPLYTDVVTCLNDIHELPGLIEPIYRAAIALDEESLDHFRFALIRIQIYSDIHRYEDLEKAQKIKYVAQVLEKIIFGNLLMEHEELSND